MSSVVCRRRGWQSWAIVCLFATATFARAESSPPVANPDAEATAEADMKPYTETLTPNNVTFHMLPIKGGRFLMGSPETEVKRGKDEGPQHEVEIAPFWMGKFEVAWEEYEIFMLKTDYQRRQAMAINPTPQDKFADALARPTSPYTDMTFGMGKYGYPAISMTHHAARMYCQWLSAKLGRYHRLPTEAEWEYACRAGTTTAYSFGDDPKQLGDYAWYFDNSQDKDGNGVYHKVGKKKPNPWGLYDMHGNVVEWCLDQYHADFYKQFAGKVTKEPLAAPTTTYPDVVRGGSWDDDADKLRSAARRGSHVDWKMQDPQRPQSVWYHTDAQFSGFRIIRPLVEPTEDEKKNIWDVGLEASGKGARVTHPGID
jgi:formylglycine-generating enzyme required for sulfatase activity